MTSERQLNWAISFYQDYLSDQPGLKSRDTKRREAKASGSKPFDAGRDPIRAADSISGLIADFEWSSKIERAELFAAWAQIVGPDSAEASLPEELTGTRLVVRCRSTAWATQLRLLHDDILAKIKERFVELEVTEIKFIGPQAPSWKKGPRSVPGRGPRDTYG